MPGTVQNHGGYKGEKGMDPVLWETRAKACWQREEDTLERLNKRTREEAEVYYTVDLVASIYFAEGKKVSFWLDGQGL